MDEDEFYRLDVLVDNLAEVIEFLIKGKKIWVKGQYEATIVGLTADGRVEVRGDNGLTKKVLVSQLERLEGDS